MFPLRCIRRRSMDFALKGVILATLCLFIVHMTSSFPKGDITQREIDSFRKEQNQVILTKQENLDVKTEQHTEHISKRENPLTNHIESEANVASTAPVEKVEVKEEQVKKSREGEFYKNVVIHFDLKGAPPKVDYFLDLLRLVAKGGATGILLEWEDMFPWTGILEKFKSTDAYSQEDVEKILGEAKLLKLDVIPLVQTFGHLEWILKYEEMRKYRENDAYPQVLCLGNNEGVEYVKEMIRQVIKKHSKYGLPYFHIGADEAFEMRKIFTVEANKNGQNDRIIAVDFQSAYKKGKCLNKTYNSSSMMVFKEICADGKTQLVFVNEVVKINTDTKLRKRDGAHARSAKATQQCWEADFPGFINAPTSSPDLKPMEIAVWGYTTQQVATKNNANLEALKIFLKKAWDDLAVNTCVPPLTRIRRDSELSSRLKVDDLKIVYAIYLLLFNEHFFGVCKESTEWIEKNGRKGGKQLLALAHLKNIAEFLKKEAGQATEVLAWHDMLKDFDIKLIKSLELGSVVQPVVWDYSENIVTLNEYIFSNLAENFPTMWASSAYKGANYPSASMSDVKHYETNNRNWIRTKEYQEKKFKKGFEGIIITGWQRYDHLAGLCEVLPIGTASMLLQMQIALNAPSSDMQLARRKAEKLLECNGFDVDGVKVVSQNCKFKGFQTYFIYQNEVPAVFDAINGELEKNHHLMGWANRYNRKYNISQNWYHREMLPFVQRLVFQYERVEGDLRSSMKDLFFENTIDEFIFENLGAMSEKLHGYIDEIQRLDKLRVWPKRSFPVGKGSK
uniref:beta-N-acetylhexosaminidase n=1 Tax=Caenorhabditis japonica TaxID=281687 RepID=A0A8R1DKS4_CAEJA